MKMLVTVLITCVLFIGNSAAFDQLLEDSIAYQPKGWHSSLKDTIHYYLESTNNVYNESVFGYKQPRSGQAYAGFTVNRTGSDKPEYLIKELNNPLVSGTEYMLTFYVSLSQYSTHGTNNIGAYVGEDLIEGEVNNYLNYFPQVYSMDQKSLTNSTSWTKVSNTFIAKGGEKYVIVGSFSSAMKNNIEASSLSNSLIHYFIDNVSLKELGEENNLIENGSFEEYEAFNNKNIPEVDTFQDIAFVKLEEVDIASMELGQKIVLHNILFETGKSILLPKSYNELNFLVYILNLHENMHIKITGHTDNVGRENFNKQLSEERAQTVIDYLLTQNVDIDRLDSEGHGSREPVRTNLTEEGRRLNRRVEFTIVKF